MGSQQLGRSPSWLKADLETKGCLQGCIGQAANGYFSPVWPCLEALLFKKLIILVYTDIKLAFLGLKAFNIF